MTAGTENNKSRLIAVRYPFEVIERADARAKQTGQTLSRAIVEAVCRGLGMGAPVSSRPKTKPLVAALVPISGTDFPAKPPGQKTVKPKGRK